MRLKANFKNAGAVRTSAYCHALPALDSVSGNAEATENISFEEQRWTGIGAIT